MDCVGEKQATYAKAATDWTAATAARDRTETTDLTATTDLKAATGSTDREMALLPQEADRGHHLGSPLRVQSNRESSDQRGANRQLTIRCVLVPRAWRSFPSRTGPHAIHSVIGAYRSMLGMFVSLRHGIVFS